MSSHPLPPWAGGTQEPTNPEVSEPSHLASQEETWLPIFYKYSLPEGKFMVLTQNKSYFGLPGSMDSRPRLPNCSTQLMDPGVPFAELPNGLGLGPPTTKLGGVRSMQRGHRHKIPSRL